MIGKEEPFRKNGNSAGSRIQVRVSPSTNAGEERKSHPGLAKHCPNLTQLEEAAAFWSFVELEELKNACSDDMCYAKHFMN